MFCLMKRALLLLVLVGVLTGQGAGYVAANAQDEFASLGLGLSISEWETIYGPLEAGQLSLLMEVPGGAIGVKSTGDLQAINIIARYWHDTPAQFEEAATEVRSYLPADAVYVESYEAELSLSNPVVIECYRSASLITRFPGSEFAVTGNISIVYMLPNLFESDKVLTAMVIAGFDKGELHEFGS